MYSLSLTEEEIAIILQALSYYQWNNPYINEEFYNIASKVQDKIDEII